MASIPITPHNRPHPSGKNRATRRIQAQADKALARRNSRRLRQARKAALAAGARAVLCPRVAAQLHQLLSEHVDGPEGR